MKCALLTNPGLAALACQELAELTAIKGKIAGGSVIFLVKESSPVRVLLSHAQAPRRFIRVLAQCEDLENLEFKESELIKKDKEKLFPEFSDGKTFKIEVENIKGQENRQVIAQKIYEKLYAKLGEKRINLKIEYQKPEIIIIVYFTGKEYLIGIDLCGKEINSRDYRVFPHSASFKGDLAYWIAHKSGYRRGERLLVGLAKDGAVPIEAGIYTFHQPFRKLSTKNLLSDHLVSNNLPDNDNDYNNKENIEAFDTSLPNVLAARKNITLARLKNKVNIQRCSLEDLDARYEEKSFDRMIFIVTSKDEEKINELYYQAGLLLKPQGTLLIFGREQWELPISEKLELINSEKIARGEGFSKIWVLRKV